MQPLDIQYELKKKGITQASIAKELDVSENHVSCVIRKVRTSDRIMRAIAKKLGRDHREVFFEHYFKKDTKKRAA